jgi:threonine/homoserine/homoserine lactone efflux protein
VDPSTALAAFGLGVALGTSPGPVQLLLFSEASRGGVRRGLLTMAGANGTFGLMMLLLAAGLASLDPGESFLRVVQVVGGAFLVFLAIDAIRENRRPTATDAERPGLHPSMRGAVAVLLNPGVYVFLATTGAAIVAGAIEEGGRPQAFAAVLALLAGVSLMDFAMVLLGTGAHRVSDRALRILGDALALGLGALGVLLILRGLTG